MNALKFTVSVYLILLMAVFASLSGCARMKMIETNVQQTNEDVKEVKARLGELIKTVDDLILSQGGVTNKMKADLTILLKQLESQLDRLHAEMDESQHRYRELEKKVDKILGQRLVLTPGNSDTSVVYSDTSLSSQGKAKVVGGLDIEKLYLQAREDYITGKYMLAFKGFNNVFDKDLTGSFKDNALYWMGECYYKDNKLDKALEYYQKAASDYPHGNKFCSALFKSGLVYDKKGDKTKKAEIWGMLLEKCPSSNEAHRAKELLKTQQ